MNIAVDLDEILADTMSPLIAFHNETYRTTFTKDHFHSYSWWEVWGGTKEQSVAKFFEFTRSRFFASVEPLPHAIQSVKHLSEKHRLSVVTSRQVELLDITTHWLDQYFPNQFSNIYVTNHPQWALGGKTTTKIETVKKIGADMLIDDSLLYAQECEADKIPVLLLNYPWNQGKLPNNTKRFGSWPEMVKHIDAYVTT